MTVLAFLKTRQVGLELAREIFVQSTLNYALETL